ncbi:hypothetical protein EVG20_g5347 [Dentipellis fragilis]|uniref:Fungal-type protein kinase domain-containing protein n=1 Tax=Dentipellis fragilis TaxID=205917 RepID=A0A4Y9YVJ3_9AGAM|nr:hypothetical protein EVG20_g5347 [Dentipellis fragilis]
MSKPRKGSARLRSTNQGPAIPPSGERVIKALPHRKHNSAHLENSGSSPKASLPASDSGSEEKEGAVNPVTIYGKKPENSTSAATSTADAPPRHICTAHAALSVNVTPKGRCDTATPTPCDDKRIALPDAGYCKSRRVYHPCMLNDLGTPLWQFKNWKEVMQVTIDVLEALDESVQAGWRHGDVSVSNIRIRGGRGLLIDRDTSQLQKSKDTTRNRKDGRRVQDLPGTWQFMSPRRLRDVSWRHDAADDRESVFWVLLWLALNYSVHSLTPVALRKYLIRIFDDYTLEDGCHTGGDWKDALFEKKCIGGYLPTTFSPDGLQNTLEELHRTFRIRPPLEPDIDGLPEERAKKTLAKYQQDLVDYEEDLAKLNDPTYIQSLLVADLDKYTWPKHGPVEHVIPPAGIYAQTVAPRPPSFWNGPPRGY